MYSVEQLLKANLERYHNALKPYESTNQFKAMLYNLVPKEQEITPLQSSRYQVMPETNQPYLIDTSLFTEALSKNPDRQHLYPCQINSCEELKNRLRNDHRVSEVFKNTLEESEKKLKTLDVKLSGEVTQKLAEVGKTQGNLLERMCTISNKLEKFLEVKHALNRDTGLELKLRTKLENIQKKLDKLANKSKATVPEQPINSFEIPPQHMEEVLEIMRVQRDNIGRLRQKLQEDAIALSKIEQKLN